MDIPGGNRSLYITQNNFAKQNFLCKMEAILEDIYLSPIIREESKTHKGETFYEKKEIRPAIIATWDGKYLTEKDLENKLTNLEFGNKEQIRALNLLQFLINSNEEYYSALGLLESLQDRNEECDLQNFE